MLLPELKRDWTNRLKKYVGKNIKNLHILSYNFLDFKENRMAGMIVENAKIKNLNSKTVELWLPDYNIAIQSDKYCVYIPDDEPKIISIIQEIYKNYKVKGVGNRLRDLKPERLIKSNSFKCGIVNNYYIEENVTEGEEWKSFFLKYINSI